MSPLALPLGVIFCSLHLLRGQAHVRAERYPYAFKQLAAAIAALAAGVLVAVGGLVL